MTEAPINLNTPPQNSPTRRISGGQLVVIVIVLAFVGFFAYGLFSKRESPRPVNGPAPEINLTLFPDYSGGYKEKITLDALRGNIVVLNFWASWCDPCKEEAATLQTASIDYASRKVVFIGADYLDQEPAARRYLEKFKITYPNGPDLASQNARRYRIQGVPETFFIKPDGTVDSYKIGPLSDSELRSCLDQLIAGGSCKL